MGKLEVASDDGDKPKFVSLNELEEYKNKGMNSKKGD